MRRVLIAVLTAPVLCLLVILIGTPTAAQGQTGTNYGFEVAVAKTIASGEFVVDITVTDLANGQVVAKPQLLGPANTDLTLVGTNGDYEYQVVTQQPRPPSFLLSKSVMPETQRYGSDCRSPSLNSRDV
jgi:hypothetical protein